MDGVLLAAGRRLKPKTSVIFTYDREGRFGDHCSCRRSHPARCFFVGAPQARRWEAMRTRGCYTRIPSLRSTLPPRFFCSTATWSTLGEKRRFSPFCYCVFAATVSARGSALRRPDAVVPCAQHGSRARPAGGVSLPLWLERRGRAPKSVKGLRVAFDRALVFLFMVEIGDHLCARWLGGYLGPPSAARGVTAMPYGLG